jgi:NADH-quinone oxidoreductase subunit D
MNADYAGSRETTEGRVYIVTGGDWDELLATDPIHDERIVLNLGPQHPSTHGVLRLVLELEGETVTSTRLVVGYLHTGIEKNAEYRNWTQGVTFLTRADYLAPIFNETVYCMGVEKLLGIQAPRRAQVIRTMLMEVNRVSSHWVALATGGMELGALTGMTNGFRARERCLDVLELITGLRMNHAYVRPGGLVQDLPADAVPAIEAWCAEMDAEVAGLDKLLTASPIWTRRLKDVGYIDTSGCLALGVTGPLLRATGLPWDLRKTEPYGVYDEIDFDVPVREECDSWARYLVRVAEMRESVRIVRQCLPLLEPGPVMVADAKIGWPAQLSLGPDGMGNSLAYVKKIMGQSMEALIHHFKLVTEGFRVPPGQVYVPVEGPRGEHGFYVVSDGSNRPWRIKSRPPSLLACQALEQMIVGGLIADVIAVIGSIDVVMGDVDR